VSGNAIDRTPFDLLSAGKEQLRQLYDALWRSSVDPVTLELCRLRIATLVQNRQEYDRREPAAAGIDDALINRLAQWPTAPGFTEQQRRALAFAEQFVIDPHGFTDEEAALMHHAFDAPALTTLTIAVAIFDALARASAVLAG
jgi:alkylhydroperoxidase family enzyme